jgi:mono/diheme cytochrome c family protein
MRHSTQARAARAAALAVAALAAGCTPPAERDMPTDEAAAVVRRYCSECHNADDLAGDIDFKKLDPAHVEADRIVWEGAVRKLRTRTMPPQDARQRPDAATYERLATRLEAELDAKAEMNPGRPALRRLNRAEYANAIRDLLDLHVDVTTLLPPDDSAFGFDNIGDLLVVSPALLERYLSAADRVSALALGDPATAVGATTYTVAGDESQATQLDGLPLGTVGGVAVTHDFPLDAEYELQVGLFRTNLEDIRGLEHEHQLEIAVDGVRVMLEGIGGKYEPEMPGAIITAKSDAVVARLRVRAPVPAGEHTVTAAFIRKMGAGTNRLRPFVRSNAGTYDATGRPHVETLTITGPFAPAGPGLTASRERIFSCEPKSAADEETCAREILTTLARRAYRRPVDDADLARLLPFYRDGRGSAPAPAPASAGSFDRGIQLALRRILASPSFVFRPERDPADVPAGAAYSVSDVELATRLSFFLWSSVPDDALLDLAAADRLHGQLETQVRRMLADPRAAALAENFAGQWLHLRNLDTIKPNTDFFPDFDNNLRQGFKREAELFFASIVDENRSILDLLTADYTFVDERLARHYGIPKVYGSRFRRVQLGPGLESRRGLLGKGGILMATSHADRTAPSLRGKWVLENLLGSPPPPPPANVPPLAQTLGRAPRTMRERMEGHRGNPACAGCHALIDPLGFAMENFDAVGAWRDLDAGAAVDASGRLADGTAIDGVAALRDSLVADPREFAATFVEKLTTYALGRGLQPYDLPVLRGILRETAADGYRFEPIVLGIVESPAFRMRLKAGEDTAAVTARADDGIGQRP